MRWWGLKGKKQDLFKNKMIIDSSWNLDENVDKMQNEKTNVINRVAKD